ncbi:alpha/beta hydrolase fold domain-containing protein [Marinobacter sp.]|uniref:alpha/beta hydrolase fold domain-containing protein n=1 Tax=Marinobacter sp. TaxID=50741 RepID=UPI0035C68D07
MIRFPPPAGKAVSLGLLVIVLATTGCATHHNGPSATVVPAERPFRVEPGLRYSPPDWPEALYADLYLPEGLADDSARPVVLMVHGGGWRRRSREDMTWIAEDVASHGFAVLNIDYRFAPTHTFPAQLHDLQIARQWLNRNADQYQLDHAQVSGFGFSSGAHLVALLGVVASSDSELNQPYGGPGTTLDAVVAGGLPSDLPAFGSGKLIRQFLGGEQRDMPETYRKASPITHVTDQSPPFFLFHGAMDALVPFSQAQRFHAELQRHGVYSELYEMHLRGHITSFLTAGNAVDEAIGFLSRQQQRERRVVSRSAQTAAGSTP